MLELSILRHFYGLSRHDALSLPHWEYESLLLTHEWLLARYSADMVMNISAGFNGDEKYYNSLIDFATPVKLKPARKELPMDATFEEIYGFNLAIDDYSKSV